MAQTASVESTGPLAAGNWATTLALGTRAKSADTNLNSYLLETTLHFRDRNYAFSAAGAGRQDDFSRRLRCSYLRIRASVSAGARSYSTTRLATGAGARM